MEPKMFKFPHIETYARVVEYLRRDCFYAGVDENGAAIFDESRPLKTFAFTGTVKLHGANAAVCDSGGARWAQSRNNILGPDMGHFGFRDFLAERKDVFDGLFALARRDAGPGDCLIFYGEWCGQGINKGTAIHRLPLRYVIFGLHGIRNGERVFYGRDIIEKLKSPENLVFNVYQFETFNVDIDLANPEKAAAEIAEATARVGENCPAGKFFGVDGKGEGIVWESVLPDRIARFKTKIDEFNVVKPRRRQGGKPLVSAGPEEIESLGEFIEYAVTENRFEQGFLEICHGKAEKGHVAPFIAWMQRDVMREENAAIEAGGLDKRRVMREIAKIARNYILARIKQED